MGIFKSPSESSDDACEDMLRLSLFYGFVKLAVIIGLL